MKTRFILFLALWQTACLQTTTPEAKQDEIVYTKTLQATEKRALADQLADLNINIDQSELLIQAYKAEQALEIWIKNKSNATFKYFKTYDFCRTSGTLGPKRQEGDYQVPEGLYHINVFNPYSQFLLSLGINYPNTSDLKRSHPTQPGGEIFIHGNCMTIGCIPITDEWIRELYYLAETAKSNGQSNIPVHIFPFKMTRSNFRKYARKYPKHKAFWQELQPFYQFFESNKQLPDWHIDSKGTYKIRMNN